MQRALEAASLHSDLAALEAVATRTVTSAEELGQNLAEVYRTVYTIDLARYDPVEAARAAPSLMTATFDLRMRLRDEIAGWHKRGFMTPDVQKGLRDAFRVARYAGDMLGEVVIGHRRLGSGEKTRRAFTGRDHNTMVHRSFDTGRDLPFRSGDVILMRGQHHNSAAIARIGDVDSQFSHLAIVYIDPKGESWLVEALIEEGCVVNRLAPVLEHDLGRAVLFRHKDADLAAKAAEFIHHRVRRSRRLLGSPILYDFSMELAAYKQLFCSKLVRQAFARASNGRVVLPSFPTRLRMKNRDFFDRIGVTATETFAPGDIDIESDFDLVAEWRDFRVTSNLRLQDMLMTKLLEWMDTHGYKFQESFAIKLISVFGRMSSRLSDEAKSLIANVVPKVPPNMSRKTIATIAMLHKTAEPIYRTLQDLEADCIRRTGRPLHPREVLEHLEGIRDGLRGEIGYLVAAR